MRGMTSSGGNSATVGFYLDDIPLAGPASAQNGHVVIDPDLYDLNRIEILRGPQGTLFGSGSMGGTVRLISNQPNLSQVQSTARSVLSGTEGGGFNHKDNLMVNLPLIEDNLAMRLVGTENYTSGWIDRIVADPFPAVGWKPGRHRARRRPERPHREAISGLECLSNLYGARDSAVEADGKLVGHAVILPHDQHSKRHQCLRQRSRHRSALPAFRHRRTADRFTDGLRPQCELQFPRRST